MGVLEWAIHASENYWRGFYRSDYQFNLWNDFWKNLQPMRTHMMDTEATCKKIVALMAAGILLASIFLAYTSPFKIFPSGPKYKYLMTIKATR